MTRLSRSSQPALQGGAWALVGIVGWIGLLRLGWSLWDQVPPRAGFDLALLLEAARHVAQGQSPYDPAMLAGASPAATALFYSYPPPVAQVLTLVAGPPDGLALILWGVGSVLGLGVIGALLARSLKRGAGVGSVLVRTCLLAPLILPFTIALLFGNLDAWYPLAYGLVLLASLPGASRRATAAGGIAVAIVVIAKLHPIALVVWLAARVLRERGGPIGKTLGIAFAAGVGIVALSLLTGGPGPWLDYAKVVQTGAGADLVDPRNIGPVSLLGQVAGLDSAALRLAAGVVAVLAIAGAAVAGWRARDTVWSFALAATASLVVLPVTWYHYPVALMPVGIVLLLRHPQARPRLVVAAVAAALAMAWPALLWIAVALVLGEAWRAGRSDPIGLDGAKL